MTKSFSEESYKSDYLTPLQIWRDFDPKRDPLEYSVVSSENDGQFTKRLMYFTAISDDDGSVRACVKMVFPTAQKNKQKFVLFLPEIDSDYDYAFAPRIQASHGLRPRYTANR